MEEVERWNRVRSKLDVLPGLLRRGEYRLKELVGSDIAIPDMLSSSHDEIVAVADFFDAQVAAWTDAKQRRIDCERHIEGLNNEAMAEPLTREEMEALLSNLRAGNTNWDKLQELQARELHLSASGMKYERARAILSEMRRFVDDLDSAYREARTGNGSEPSSDTF